jgi:LPS-assembly lipoprotein
LWHRRNLLAQGAILGGAGLLAACGFRPLYGPDGERASGAGFSAEPRLLQELAAVRVTRIPERSGQLLRRMLERRFESMGPGTPARYELQTSFSTTVEALGFRRSGVVSRVRAVGSAPWTLTDGGTPPTVLGRGLARTLDSFNLPDLQFFAAEVAQADMERRMLDELGDRIVIGVAAALRQRLQA